MNMTVGIARKELKTYFLSPIALLFIATFLLASLFSFFWIEGFFARNIADIRPLFSWLPVLLIFLVPALGMRLWAEEERAGTLEVLRTKPLSTLSLVAGKFMSGLTLVAVCLALTLPVPLTVEYAGDLDWGPVMGGYVATLLVAGAYLSITLCISALTSNQIVALVFGSLACGALYLVGADAFAHFFGNKAGEVLRALGAGSRFESILRGVLDVRDLLYYGSIIGFFLLINHTLIEGRRWSRAARRRRHRRNAYLTVGLVGANLVALNVLVYPVRALRLDLTERGEYSVSDVTRELLAGLDEPLLIRGYFSEKTHPLLAPLVPRIRDMIEEYSAIGGASVNAEFIDPTTDPELEQEANQAFGIESVPFQFADRHEAAIVNSYFHVLVRYGDQQQVLSWDDLIEVQAHGMDINVQLRNLEYDLTRAVQKVKYGFQSLESIMARLPDRARFSVFITEASLPQGFAEIRERVEAVAREFERRSNGRFTWRIVDPDQPGAAVTREQLQETYGLRPMALSLMSDQTFYFDLLLEIGERKEHIVPAETLTEADIRKELRAALARAIPGALKTLGVFSGDDTAMSFSTLEEVLGETYQVEAVSMKDGRVPAHIDVLLVIEPKEMSERELYALDQFLMRGGSAIVSSSKYAIDSSGFRSLAVAELDSGLKGLLEHYGVEVGDQIVLDLQSAAFPIPVDRDLGGFTVRQLQVLDYPAFVDVRGAQFDPDNPAVESLGSVVLHWPSPVRFTKEKAPAGGERAVLLRSSDEAWTLASYEAQPDFDRHPELGWAVGDSRKSQPLAVLQVGALTSYYKDRDPPALGGPTASPDPHGAIEEESEDRATAHRGEVIERSPADTRLVVIGSASFLSDPVVELGRQLSDAYLNNMQLVQNLVDWSLEDAELLSIRSRGSHARILNPLSDGTRNALEWANYLFALASVALIGAVTLTRRRRARPMVGPPETSHHAGTPSKSAKGEAAVEEGTRHDAA